MKLDINLIFNLIIALFLYQIVLKGIGQVLFNMFMKSSAGQSFKKELKEKLKEKMNQSE